MLKVNIKSEAPCLWHCGLERFFLIAKRIAVSYQNLTVATSSEFGSSGNPPLEPRGLEVEFFPKEEVLHEKVKIYG